MTADEGERWGFHNRVVAPEELAETALVTARDLASGPSFAHGMTKTQLNIEWNVSLDTAIEMEAQAQAICMQTNDFGRAFERSEEHTSELQSLMRISYAVFCLKKKKTINTTTQHKCTKHSTYKNILT